MIKAAGEVFEQNVCKTQAKFTLGTAFACTNIPLRSLLNLLVLLFSFTKYILYHAMISLLYVVGSLPL